MDAIEAYCPTCNRVVTARVGTEVGGTVPSDFWEEMPEHEEGYRGAVYGVAFCPKCERVFLHVRTTTEPSGFPKERVLYPDSKRRSIPGLPTLVRRWLDRAWSCYETGNPEACVAMCRTSLEATCSALGVKEQTLNAQLVRLRDSGTIEPRLLEWAHAVRVAGNDAVHDIEAQVSEGDARDALELIETLLLYVFTVDAKFKQFMARRAGTPGKAPP